MKWNRRIEDIDKYRYGRVPAMTDTDDNAFQVTGNEFISFTFVTCIRIGSGVDVSFQTDHFWIHISVPSFSASMGLPGDNQAFYSAPLCPQDLVSLRQSLVGKWIVNIPTA